MRFRQIKSILHLVEHHHVLLQNLLGQAELVTADRSTAQFISDLRLHEQRWSQAIRAYLRDGNSGVLDTWIQLTPDLELPCLNLPEGSADELSSETAAAAVCEFHKTMERLYDSLSCVVTAQAPREFLLHLLRLERTVITERAWSARLP